MKKIASCLILSTIVLAGLAASFAITNVKADDESDIEFLLSLPPPPPPAPVSASAFGDAEIMTDWTWCIIAQGSGGSGTYTYQWYEGATLLAGQTDLLLAVTKATPGIYNYTCKVTDSADGASAVSNAVVLNVFA